MHTISRLDDSETLTEGQLAGVEAFLGDGVYQLVKGQDTKGLEVKNFAPAFRALEDYDVTKLYVDEAALQARGLSAGDLMVPVEVVNAQRMAEIMEAHDVVLSF